MSHRFSSITLMSTLFIAAVGASLVGGCSSSDSSDDATLTIKNDESFDITHIYIDSVGDEDFTAGDDILGGVPLDNGDTITVSATCDSYDIEIIDESGADCIIQDYALCATDDLLDITDSFCGLSSRVGSGTVGPVTHAPTASHTPVQRNVSILK